MSIKFAMSITILFSYYVGNFFPLEVAGSFTQVNIYIL